MTEFWQGVLVGWFGLLLMLLTMLALIVVAGLVLQARDRAAAPPEEPEPVPEPQKALPPGPSAHQAAVEPAMEPLERALALPRLGAVTALFYVPAVHEQTLVCMAGHELTAGALYWEIEVEMPDDTTRLAVCAEHAIAPRSVEEPG